MIENIHLIIADFLPSTFLGWIAFSAVVISGIISIIGMFRKDVDKQQDKLIQRLKEHLEVLEKAVSDQEKKQLRISDKLNKTIIENELMKEVLMERDKEAKDRRAKIHRAINRGIDSHRMIKNVNKNLNALTIVLKDFIETMKNNNQGMKNV